MNSALFKNALPFRKPFLFLTLYMNHNEVTKLLCELCLLTRVDVIQDVCACANMVEIEFTQFLFLFEKLIS